MMRAPPFEDELHDPEWTEIPPLEAEYRVDLSGCTGAVEIGAIDAPVVVLRGCTALRRLPALPRVIDLDLTGCASLQDLGDGLPERMGRLILRGCAGLRALPARLARVGELDISGTAVAEWPVGLRIDRWVEVTGAPIRALPALGPHARVLYRGVGVPPGAVLRPEQLDPIRILTERNAEVRRVLIELVGYERLVNAARGAVIDTDTDPGGPRALIEIELPATSRYQRQPERVVCLSVRCPSTGRRYVLRVPPHVRTCHAAAAWIAGFDDPEAYRPVRET